MLFSIIKIMDVYLEMVQYTLKKGLIETIVFVNVIMILITKFQRIFMVIQYCLVMLVKM